MYINSRQPNQHRIKYIIILRISFATHINEVNVIIFVIFTSIDAWLNYFAYMTPDLARFCALSPEGFDFKVWWWLLYFDNEDYGFIVCDHLIQVSIGPQVHLVFALCIVAEEVIRVKVEE